MLIHAQMKRILPILGTFLAAALVHAADLDWTTDPYAAMKKAAAEDKTVLLNFTGPDDRSRQLKEEVFDQPEFIAFAHANLVLVEIDLTPHPHATAEQKATVEKMVDEFQVEGSPITYILDKAGVRLAKAGYVEGGAKNYIALITKIPGFKAKPYQVDAPPPPKNSTNATEKVEQPFVLLVPVVKFNDLYLRGISLVKQKAALINNKTITEGEKATLKIGTKWVTVQCVEIRTDSVIVQVEEEANTRELRFKPQSDFGNP